MTEAQVARNGVVIRAIAARLEAWGLDDAHQRAEWLLMNAFADGYRAVEPPPAPRGPGASRQAIESAKAAAAQAVRDAKERGARL